MVGLIPAGLARSRGFYPYRIDHALRLNAADSAYLNWAPSVNGSDTTGTFRFLIKRTVVDVATALFGAGSGSAFTLRFFATNELQLGVFDSGNNFRYVQTSALYRDPSAWYDIVGVFDWSNATQSDRIRLYVNGVRINDFSASSLPGNTTFKRIFDASITHEIGRRTSTGDEYFDGYIADSIVLDGIAASPTDFGQFKNGVWIPKRYSGSYGTNGFHLDFSDAANLGKDVSGNGNDFTTNNITSDDQVEDTPTKNWSILLPIDEDASGTLVEAATEVSGTVHQLSTFAVSTGKYAWKTTLNAAGDIGIEDTDENETTVTGSNGDVIQLRLDADAGTLESNTNGGGWTSVATGLSGTFHALFKTDCSIDFGQYGYTPPAGFKALNAANLPKPKIIQGSKYFNAVTYTGNGGTQSITGVGFKPDLVWIKCRTNDYYHVIYDTVRGAERELHSNTDEAEDTQAENGYVTSFDTDGFTVVPGSTNALNVNFSGEDYVAWCWKKGVTPGFDIVGYTGDGNAGRTISHSLGQVPAVMILKDRDSNQSWVVYHHEAASDPETDFLRLQNAEALIDNADVWNDTAPTASDFTVGISDSTNVNGRNFIVYLFAEVPGFSRFGSYTGNGSSDGPFVWCGFRPAFVLVKRTDSNNSWSMQDSGRSVYNPVDDVLYSDLQDTEYTRSAIDFLSNGFKLRSTDSPTNANGGNYVFMAFAEHPFKFANAR